MLIFILLMNLARADEIEMTVSEMLPYLSNQEGAQVWLAETADDTQKNKANSRNPNDRNTYQSLKDSIPPVWTCTDGDGKDKVTFQCWAEDKAKCTPEWHTLLGMSCPVSCTPYVK